MLSLSEYGQNGWCSDNMPKLLQLNVTANWGSTGKIAGRNRSCRDCSRLGVGYRFWTNAKFVGF